MAKNNIPEQPAVDTLKQCLNITDNIITKLKVIIGTLNNSKM